MMRVSLSVLCRVSRDALVLLITAYAYSSFVAHVLLQ
jgi:hypothetical protein